MQKKCYSVVCDLIAVCSKGTFLCFLCLQNWFYCVLSLYCVFLILGFLLELLSLLREYLLLFLCNGLSYSIFVSLSFSTHIKKWPPLTISDAGNISYAFIMSSTQWSMCFWRAFTSTVISTGSSRWPSDVFIWKRLFQTVDYQIISTVHNCF